MLMKLLFTLLVHAFNHVISHVTRHAANHVVCQAAIRVTSCCYSYSESKPFKAIDIFFMVNAASHAAGHESMLLLSVR